MQVMGIMVSIMASVDHSSHVDELWHEVEPALKFAEKPATFTLWGLLQLPAALQEPAGKLSYTGSFDGDGFSEQEHLKQFTHNRQAVSYYYVIRALAAVIYEDYRTAYRMCRDAVPLMSHVSGFIMWRCIIFYIPLSICQVLETEEYRDRQEERQKLLKVLKDNQDWLKKRSGDAYCNFGHLYLLIEAEQKAVCGCIGEALKLYECAMEAAGKHNRSPHQAIICGVTAQRYRRIGVKSVFRHYLRNTYRLYSVWGAEGKCAGMRQDYPELAGILKSEESRQTTLSGESIQTTTSLDMKSVLKASQAISEELELKGSWKS